MTKITSGGTAPKDSPLVILHIPHSSRRIPQGVRETIALDDRDLARELIAMTDHHTDDLFRLEHELAQRVVYPWSRLVADPERFERDEEEEMSAVGMGAVYTRTSGGASLRGRLTAGERESILETYCRPHHRRVERLAEAAVEKHGTCLIVDCHSFPSRPLPCDADQDPDRPDICIGTTGGFHPEWLPEELDGMFEGEGFTVRHGRPYDGAYIPARYNGRGGPVASVMIEVNRRLYADERTGRKKKGFDRIARALQSVLGALADMWIEESDQYIYERIQEEGALMASQDWDSGGPGAGAGTVYLYEYWGRYYIYHDAGMSGPYDDYDEAMKDSGIDQVTDATREIAFRSDIEG